LQLETPRHDRSSLWWVWVGGVAVEVLRLPSSGSLRMTDWLQRQVGNVGWLEDDETGCEVYWGFAVSARKTRSSTATEWVKTVAEVAPEDATRLALPLRAGPAGLVLLLEGSPGWSEMRVVFGAQFAAPMHVSRTKT
jgi:hypothetical protein